MDVHLLILHPFHQMENLLHLIQIEVVYSKFMLCEVTEQMLKITFGNGIYGTPVWSPRRFIALQKCVKESLYWCNEN